jgi:hypothetical protein
MTETTEQAPYVWELTPAEYAATVDKVAAINDRAAKRGFTGRIELTGIPATKIWKDQISGLELTAEVVRVTITGQAPSYNGWTFQATLDWDTNAGLITRNAPGVESVNREGLVEGYCGHCKTSRARNRTFLVANVETGETVQVGSTCIKDFLGWKTLPVFLSVSEVREEIESWGFGGYSDPSYSTETVLAAALAVIKAEGGYVPSSGYGATIKSCVYDVLDPRSSSAREYSRTIAPYVAEAASKAATVREFILSDEFNGNGDYVLNLKAACRTDYVSARNIGLVVSAPQAWAKAEERTLVRQREAQQLVNEYVGKPKDRLELTVTVRMVRYSTSYFGYREVTTTIYRLVDEGGRTFTWFSTNGALGDDTGAKFRIKGTVKGHEEYQGTKQTVLTRCSVIEEITG